MFKCNDYTDCGDFNPITTGMDQKDITSISNLRQLVHFNTRDSGILDWFFTNRPKIYKLQQLPKIGRSDHYAFLGQPITSPPPKVDSVKKIKVRQSRASNWRDFGAWITRY